MPALTPEQSAQIDELIFVGNKIGAIKLYRSIVGGELVDAKNFVDARYEELKRLEPGRIRPPQSGCGFFFVLLLVALAAAVAGYFLTRH